MRTERNCVQSTTRGVPDLQPPLPNLPMSHPKRQASKFLRRHRHRRVPSSRIGAQRNGLKLRVRLVAYRREGKPSTGPHRIDSQSAHYPERGRKQPPPGAIREMPCDCPRPSKDHIESWRLGF